jgi:hypothetical protein
LITHSLKIIEILKYNLKLLGTSIFIALSVSAYIYLSAPVQYKTNFVLVMDNKKVVENLKNPVILNDFIKTSGNIFRDVENASVAVSPIVLHNSIRIFDIRGSQNTYRLEFSSQDLRVATSFWPQYLPFAIKKLITNEINFLKKLPAELSNSEKNRLFYLELQLQQDSFFYMPLDKGDGPTEVRAQSMFQVFMVAISIGAFIFFSLGLTRHIRNIIKN